jgi:hypothetical protein
MQICEGGCVYSVLRLQGDFSKVPLRVVFHTIGAYPGRISLSCPFRVSLVMILQSLKGELGERPKSWSSDCICIRRTSVCPFSGNLRRLQSSVARCDEPKLYSSRWYAAEGHLVVYILNVSVWKSRWLNGSLSTCLSGLRLGLEVKILTAVSPRNAVDGHRSFCCSW